MKTNSNIAFPISARWKEGETIYEAIYAFTRQQEDPLLDQQGGRNFSVVANKRNNERLNK